MRKKLTGFDTDKLATKAKEEFEQGFSDAKEYLEDEDKMEKLLRRLEAKLKKVPLVGERISNIPILVSLLRSYVKKEYTEVPLGTILAVISCLVYWLAPIDIIPDFLGAFGYTDDAIVTGIALSLINSDLVEYIEWRDKKEMEYEENITDED
ncbi:MAG: DUF1232 domain-containing protein [Clostridia bacterium]|nr:DUF1232 domain-containing protein [Clostridia bacterium]